MVVFEEKPLVKKSEYVYNQMVTRSDDERDGWLKGRKIWARTTFWRRKRVKMQFLIVNFCTD